MYLSKQKEGETLNHRFFSRINSACGFKRLVGSGWLIQFPKLLLKLRTRVFREFLNFVFSTLALNVNLTKNCQQNYKYNFLQYRVFYAKFSKAALTTVEI